MLARRRPSVLAALLCFAVACAISRTAEAQYPSAKKNSNVREEVQADSANRVIPVTEHFAFAVDGDVFLRTDGVEEFYHGIGYWLQARSEAMPQPWLRLNVRSIFYAGSCSYGYVQPSGQYHLVGVTATLPQPFLGGELKLRGPDVERVTAGRGLFIQEREFNGVWLGWKMDGHRFDIKADGTGVLRLNDDTYVFEGSIFSDALGVGAVVWPEGEEQDMLPADRASLYYAFSAHTFDWFTYEAEVGTRAGATAGLGALIAKGPIGPVEARLKLEGRRYQYGFAKDFAGNIEQQYVAYDQYDKDFTDTGNIFVVDDTVNVEAAHLDLWWKINHAWRIYTLNEAGRFLYSNEEDVAYYFFRHGVDYCFVDGRDDCMNLFFTNKVMMNSFARPPEDISRSNEPAFKMFPFVGLEGRFRF